MVFSFVACENESNHVHDFQWKEVKAATCTEDGVKQEICSICKAEGKTEVIKALGHAVKDGKCVRCDATDLKVAKVGDVEYTTLAEAIEKAESGSVITLLCDSYGKGLGSKDGEKIKESLIIDFNNHTYTMNDPAVGSTGYETQAMHWGTSLGAVTMKNGTFNVVENPQSVKMAMQNYINFTAENMTFDFTNIPVVHYGEDEFSGENVIYNGLEVPLFNNNKGEMLLKDCTVVMPVESNKGISADGTSVTFENTTIDGYVNIQEASSKLILKGNSKVKDVVPYFAKDSIKKATEGNDTIYTVNKAK